VIALLILTFAGASLFLALTSPRRIGTLTPEGIRFDVDGLGLVPWEHMTGYNLGSTKPAEDSSFTMPLVFRDFYKGRFRRGAEVYFGVRRQTMTWNERALNLAASELDQDGRDIAHYLSTHLKRLDEPKPAKTKGKAAKSANDGGTGEDGATQDKAA
jgi:hypothetical protein